MSIHEYFAFGKTEDGRKNTKLLWKAKSLSFCEIWNDSIQSLLYWLLDHKEIQQGWILDFLYRFQYISAESSCQEEERTITNYSFQEKMC